MLMKYLIKSQCNPEVLKATVLKSIYTYYPETELLENVLKWSTDSDTNLTIVCRHRWSR